MAKRKLIEVAIPLDAINGACRADKGRTTGTLRNLHKWFAPMPLPAWRALLFATLVDDPGNELERNRLLRLTERLVENGGDPPARDVLEEARREISANWPHGLPAVLDPFCGGGSTLVEAQRLGCPGLGSDLNPVPVLISRTVAELLPAVADEPALHPSPDRLQVGAGAYQAVADDVTHYAARIHARVRARLASLYATPNRNRVVAWLWARTVTCPNPACRRLAPLIDSTWLSKKTGAECFLTLETERGDLPVFRVTWGTEPPVRSTVERSGAHCVHCNGHISFAHVRGEGIGGRLGFVLTAVAEERDGDRHYRDATSAEMENALAVLVPDDLPEITINPKGMSIRTPLYGLTRWTDLYTPRQLATLCAFADEVAATHDELLADGASAPRAEAVAAVLALCVGKLAQFSSTQVRWYCDTRGSRHSTPQAAFGRHDLPMTWDFPEVNILDGASGSWTNLVQTALRSLTYIGRGRGQVRQGDARSAAESVRDVIVATDPPYFDQIGYADLSDYFYMWHRRALRRVFRDMYRTMATPKEGELIALASRHDNSKASARTYFVEGFTETFHSLRAAQHPDAPMLVVYAFKEQSRSRNGTEQSPGWEAILEAMVSAELAVVGTWPIAGTDSARMISMGSNALATYVVLVCRPRAVDAARITRSDLSRLLRTELGGAVERMQQANIAPVDLAQAVIGPGMEVFSRHREVIEPDGTRVSVGDALALINRTLAEVLDEQEGDLDPDSRWAVTWYEQHGFNSSTFGEADQLARAKGISVDALYRAGIIRSGGSKVQLIPRAELPDGWDPATDRRSTAWEAVQHLIRVQASGGEPAAAALFARLGTLREPARELAYRLFRLAEKNGRTEEAIAYNGLVTSWSEITRLAGSQPMSASEALF
jgi:putative DNA methylase